MDFTFSINIIRKAEANEGLTVEEIIEYEKTQRIKSNK